MNRAAAIAGAGLLLAATATLVGSAIDAVRPVTDAVKSLDTQRETALEPSKLAAFPDGGLAYAVEARVADGGVELRRVPPGCVRRPLAARPDTCLRLLPDEKGVPVPTDFGALNRFPASEAVGAGCQPVACSVYAGEDADADEAQRVRDAAEKERAR